MQSLATRIPDIEALLSLEPEELGAHLLFLLQREPGQQGMHILGNSISALVAGYPGERLDQAMDAVAEAWSWLEAQSLLIPAWRNSGSAPWRILSRRARSFTSSRDFTVRALGNLLPKAYLHANIPAQVWPNFVKGDYDTAVFQAMKQVEIALRDATGIHDETSGVRLARRAFHTDDGPLTDLQAERGEREAMMHLVSGAIGTLKNPHSHRNVELTEPAEAAAAIMLASYLLRLIEAREFVAKPA